MSAHTTHPLIDAYLRDLELQLQGVDPGDRAEVLAGVREHLGERLGSEPADDEVRAALAELGPAQAIADEAYAGRPSPSPRGSGAMSRPWVPVTVGILLGLALVTAVLVVGSFSGYSTSGSASSDGAGNVVSDQQVQFTGVGPGGVLIALLASWFFWVPATVLAVASPLWTGRQKVTLGLLVPGAAAVLVGLPALGWGLSGTELGINLGAWTSLVLALGGGGWLVWRLCRTAARRAAP